MWMSNLTHTKHRANWRIRELLTAEDIGLVKVEALHGKINFQGDTRTERLAH